MKKIITLFSTALLFICAHPKMTTIATIFMASNASAQFDFTFNPADSSWTNQGGWSLVPMYIQKDSTANPDSYYFKHNEPNIFYLRFKAGRNDGTPKSILWTDETGRLHVSDFKAGTGMSISGGTLTNTSPDQLVSINGTGATTVTGSYPNFSINTSTVQGNITPTITAAGSATVISSGNTFTISAPASAASTSITSGGGINISGSAPNYTISLPSTTTGTVSRPITSTSYTISTTQDYIVNYSVYAQVTSALAGTNTANVFLDISPNNSTWTTISQSGISLVGLVATSGNTQSVTGTVPKNYWARIRTVAAGANSGNAVFTYQIGNETSK